MPDMHGPHLQAAARDAHLAYFDDYDPSPVQLALMESAFAAGLKTWLDSLLRELPEEAVGAGGLVVEGYYPRAIRPRELAAEVLIAGLLALRNDGRDDG